MSSETPQPSEGQEGNYAKDIEHTLRRVFTGEDSYDDLKAVFDREVSEEQHLLRLIGGLSPTNDVILFDPRKDIKLLGIGSLGPRFEVTGHGTEGMVTVLLVPGVEFTVNEGQNPLGD